MRISVILAVYNRFDEARLLHAIASLLAQEHVELDVSLAESNSEPALAQRMSDLGVRYVFTPAGARIRPGYLRNLALSLATGEYIYSTDADIALPTDFIAHLVSLGPGAWIHPPKRRLPKAQFGAFEAHVAANGLSNTFRSLGADRFFATLAAPVPYRLSENGGKHYTCTASDYELWRSAGRPRGHGPVYWDSTRHRGGTFAPRADWIAAGGYSDVYCTWGYEDADLQWKLGLDGPLAEMPDDDRFRVLHLDHEKTYFSATDNLENKYRFEARRLAPRDAIAYDRVRLEAVKP